MNSINKGDFPLLSFHFQRSPGPDMAEAIYCGSRVVTTAARMGDIRASASAFIGQLFLGGSSSGIGSVNYESSSTWSCSVAWEKPECFPFMI